MLDHELVEYFVALTIPRRDTKTHAKALIAQFGGIGPLLSARAETLKGEGLTEGVVAALKIAEATPVDEASMHVREVMKRAMADGATAIIIVHNHPSGDPTPSQADVKLTREMVEAGRHLKVVVHDHVSVGVQCQSSLRAICLLSTLMSAYDQSRHYDP